MTSIEYHRHWVNRRRPPQPSTGFRSLDGISVEEVQPEDDDLRRLLDRDTDISSESADGSSGRSFRVVSCNILSDNCIGEGQYLYCPIDFRYMNARHVQILAEIRSLRPDVVCFQEADEDNFRNRLESGMKALGYEGLNHPTPSNGQGLATFWRSDQFELVKQKSVRLSEVLSDYLEKAAVSDQVRSSIEGWFQKPEVASLVHLRHLATDRDVMVGNNHVTWMGLRYPVLQALQITLALRELIEFAGRSACPLVFCGDFNTPPSFPAYQLLSKGHIGKKDFEQFAQNHRPQPDEVDWRNFSAISEAIPDIFQLPLKLESAYYSVQGREPNVTNCDGAHEDGIVRPLCLDYIWFRTLEVTSVLETPALTVLTEHVALPSARFPSDHIPIAAEFVIK